MHLTQRVLSFWRQRVSHIFGNLMKFIDSFSREKKAYYFLPVILGSSWISSSANSWVHSWLQIKDLWTDYSLILGCLTKQLYLLLILDLFSILQPIEMQLIWNLRAWALEPSSPGYRSWFCHLIATWSWSICLTFLSLSFLICKMGIIIVLTS